MKKTGELDLALHDRLDGLNLEDLQDSAGIKWRRYGRDVLPAWVAEMDFPVAPPIREALGRLVSRSQLGYHNVPISTRLRRALVQRLAERFGWTVAPEQVRPLVNVVQGLEAAVFSCTRPGEGVLVQTPIYPPFLEAVRSTGRRLDACPWVCGPERYEIDFDALGRSIRPDTRLFLLCHPHNPTGRLLDSTELKTLAEWAIRHDWIVVSDEIHADLNLTPTRTHQPFASIDPEVAQRTITLTSATKAFNLAGLPCAFAILGGEPVERRWRALPPHLLGHSGILDDAATFTAWTEGQAWLETVLSLLKRNRQELDRRIREDLPEINWHPPEATYLAWLDCRAMELEEPAQFFLEHARVALSNGRDFGPPGQGFVRLNFATSGAILRKIIDRMAESSLDRRS